MINSMNMFFSLSLDEVGMFDVVRETCKCGTQAIVESCGAIGGKGESMT